MTSILFGYHMPNFSFPGVPREQLFEHLAKLACAAEDAGFDLVTVMDHFYQIRGAGPETEPMLESYTALAALAARTRRVKLGTLLRRNRSRSVRDIQDDRRTSDPGGGRARNRGPARQNST